MARSYAAAPIVVGKPDIAAPRHECPIEETLCPVVSHGWVNDEYKHLVVEASPKALAARPGQFFQLLCPTPDEVEVWFLPDRRNNSVRGFRDIG